MSDEPNSPDLQPWIDPELEARVVAWVLGEASDFEASELTRIIDEKPELAVFKRRIQAVHGLVGAASQLEADPMRMVEDRRQKLLETLRGKNPAKGEEPATAEKPRAAVTAMPQRKAKVEPKRSLWGTVGAVAACLAVVALLWSISLPAFTGVQIKAAAAKALSEKMQAQLQAQIASQADLARNEGPATSSLRNAYAEAAAPVVQSQPVQVSQLAALNALKAQAMRPRIEDDDDGASQAGPDRRVVQENETGAGASSASNTARREEFTDGWGSTQPPPSTAPETPASAAELNALKAGEVALKQRDYETAFAQYKLATDHLPESDGTHSLRRQALDGLDDAACSLAEQRISEGRYEDASNVAKAVLDPAYDPNCHRAVVILAHLEDPDYYNKAVTPRFRGNVEEVKNLFQEAKGYEETGRYDKAYQTYDKILNLDPYNVAARKRQEDVNSHRDQYANQAYEDTRSDSLWELDKGWELPVHRFGQKNAEITQSTPTDGRTTDNINNKLNRIIIPKLDLHDATLRQAIDTLKQQSVQLDTQEPDPTRRGVNIVEQLDPFGNSYGNSNAQNVQSRVPGLEPNQVGAPSPADDQKKLTLSLSNIPLGEALKYIAQLSDQKLKIDPYAVSIVPPSVNTEDLITKEYNVPPGFLAAGPDTSGAGSSLDQPAARGGGGFGGAGGGDATGAGAGIPATQSAMDYLTANGIPFPPGASAVYFPASRKLIVRNTPSNVELADQIMKPAGAEAPASADATVAADSVAGAAADSNSIAATGGPVAPYSIGAAVAANGNLEASNGSTAFSIPAASGAAASPANLPPPAATVSGPIDSIARPSSPAAATVAPTESVASATPAEAAQKSIEAKFVDIQQQNEKELSMNDLLGQSNISGKRIFGAGGVTADSRAATANTPVLGDVASLGIPLMSKAYRERSLAPGPMIPAPTPDLGELSASDQPFSTFSLHVSDVSFRLAKEELAQGSLPDRDSIRPEEFYNAFDYGDPAPAPAEQIACKIEQAAHPLFQQRNLVRIAMKVAAAGRDAQQPLRLTVLLDTSGSMEREDRAASVQSAMKVLTSLLGPKDSVTLIGFAREPRLLAEAVPGDQSAKLVDIVKRTPPEGGTNMEEALKLATQLALRHCQDGGQNRVVMLTDGAANLGDADAGHLSQIVGDLRQRGISFDACGVGAKGLNDTILEALTRKGGGRYYFLNTPEDAGTGFAQELAGAFRPAAENVKMQVRFNPDRVGKYRLIGFDKNRLNQEDFRNDNVTAAQLAAEEAAMALYQVQVLPEGSGELGEVFVRFRDPANGRMVEQSWPIPYDPRAPALDQASPSMQLAAASALVAEKLRGGPGSDALDLATLEPIVARLRSDDYRTQQKVQDFATMFDETLRMTAKKQ